MTLVPVLFMRHKLPELSKVHAPDRRFTAPQYPVLYSRCSQFVNVNYAGDSRARVICNNEFVFAEAEATIHA